MITITVGEKAQFEIKLRDIYGDPYDLSGFDKFKVCIPVGQGSGLTVSETPNANGSVVAKITGKTYQGLNVTLAAADTTGLEVEDRLYIDIELDNAGTPNPKRQRFKNALNVDDSCVS